MTSPIYRENEIMKEALEKISNLIDYTTVNDFTDYVRTAKFAVAIAQDALDKIDKI